MTNLLSSCKKFFGTKDLYKLLGVPVEAKISELKKAYYKLSLEVHPDRVDESEKDISTKKFQVLGKVYAILSDKEKKATYDETGEVDEEDCLQENKDWDQYWRILFKKISVSDIENFAKTYRESDEEMADLKQSYLDGEGDMQYILENVLCASCDDENRFDVIIKGWIKENQVPPLDKFTKQTKKQKNSRKRKAAKEAEEAELLKKDLGMGDSENSLMQMIAKKNKERSAQLDSFYDSLEEKYAPKKGKKKAKY